MLRRSSLGWPITLGVVMIALLIALIIGWFVVAYGSVLSLTLGTVFLALVLVGVVFYLLISIKEIRLNQRQSNFIDSVTHELKSPIASLKLYLQTLARRNVPEEQQANFYRIMLEDLNRLDTLINHMLDAARLDQAPVESEIVEVDLPAVLKSCTKTACLQYRLAEDTISVDAQPAVIKARPIDVEMVFRNLVDNALKYSGDIPKVSVESWTNGRGRVITRITDNGPGIPAKLRRKIFGRFVRLGNELERQKTGTGLGLFIVRTLVKRMKGKITVRGRTAQPGTVFEVELPAA
jgi:signal transduction histidine kinase